jgi:hypothetical protein
MINMNIGFELGLDSKYLFSATNQPYDFGELLLV